MPDPDPDDLLAPADALAAMLRGETEEDDWREASIAKLAGITVIVNRQLDILSEIAKEVAKAKGAAIVIMLDGWSEPPRSNAAVLDLSHSISLCVRPVMRAGQVPAMTALGALIRAIQGWQPDADADERWMVGAGAYAEAEANKTRFNIYEFPASFEVTLYPES